MTRIYNIFYYCFIVFYFLLTSSLPSSIPRLDFTREITSATGDTRGNWRTEKFCPDDNYVYGFNQKIDCSSYGSNIIQLVCGLQSYSQLYSHDDSNGNWQNEANTYCSSGDFMKSYKVKKDGYYSAWIGSNDLSISDVDIRCSSETTYRNPGGGCSSGSWTNPASCNEGEAICGYQIRFDEDTSLVSFVFQDNVGMSDTRFYCCLVCKKTDGWFLDSGPKCSVCHSYCKTCTGSGANQCSSCFSFDTTSGTSCSTAVNYYETISTTDGASIASLGVAVSISSCLGLTWLGGSGILGSGNFFEITVSGKPQHYKIRIKFKFLKIDSWSGHNGEIYVDGVIQNINELKSISSSSGSLNFGNQCGGSDPEDVINIDYEMTHKLMPFTVKFTSNLDGTSTTKSWAIRNLIIGLYKCDYSCATCSGSSATECLTCYPNAEKVGGLCVCKTTFYAEVVTPTCTSDICTVCKSCSVGCNTCTSGTDCAACSSSYFLYTDASTSLKSVL